MDQIKAITEAWPVLAGLIGLVVWAVRLEGKITLIENSYRQLETEHNSLRAEHNALNSSTLQELSKIRESLARIEGRLLGQFDNPS